MLRNFPRKFWAFVLWVRKNPRKIPSKFPTKFFQISLRKIKKNSPNELLQERREKIVSQKGRFKGCPWLEIAENILFGDFLVFLKDFKRSAEGQPYFSSSAPMQASKGHSDQGTATVRKESESQFLDSFRTPTRDFRSSRPERQHIEDLCLASF